MVIEFRWDDACMRRPPGELPGRGGRSLARSTGRARVSIRAVDRLSDPLVVQGRPKVVSTGGDDDRGAAWTREVMVVKKLIVVMATMATLIAAGRVAHAGSGTSDVRLFSDRSAVPGTWSTLRTNDGRCTSSSEGEGIVARAGVSEIVREHGGRLYVWTDATCCQRALHPGCTLRALDLPTPADETFEEVGPDEIDPTRVNRRPTRMTVGLRREPALPRIPSA